MNERCLVAGFEAVNALGPDMKRIWPRIMAGESGICGITHPTDERVRVASVIPEGQLKEMGLAPREADNLAGDLTVFVGKNALEDAKQRGFSIQPEQTGLVLSTTKGEISQFLRLIQEKSHEAVFDPYQLALRAASVLSLGGPVMVVSNACASGLVAIAQAARLVEDGLADHMLVVGVDLVSDFVLAGFACLGALSPDPCRPFDADRSGLTLGEGAGALVLTRQSEARAAARITGWGITNDANHITGPSRTGRGLKQALESTFAMAGKTPADVDFINAHGTGTIFNDESETKAYYAIFGDHPPLTGSLKGYFGHTLGAAGVLETAITLKTFETGLVPGTIGFSRPGVASPINITADSVALSRCRNIVTAKAGFSGINAVLLLEAVTS